MEFFAIELPAARIAFGVAREFEVFIGDRVEVWLPCKLLQKLSHHLVNTLTHGFRMATCFLNRLEPGLTGYMISLVFHSLNSSVHWA